MSSYVAHTGTAQSRAALTSTHSNRNRPRRASLSAAEIAVLSLVALVIVATALLPALRHTEPTWDSTVTVKVGETETLWGLAQAHPLRGFTTAQTVAAIKEENGLDRSDLQAGQLLKVPSDSGAMASLASR